MNLFIQLNKIHFVSRKLLEVDFISWFMHDLESSKGHRSSTPQSCRSHFRPNLQVNAYHALFLFKRACFAALGNASVWEVRKMKRHDIFWQHLHVNMSHAFSDKKIKASSMWHKSETTSSKKWQKGVSNCGQKAARKKWSSQ